MGEWLYYNFAAASFHTKKLCSRLYSIKIWGGGLDIRTPSIARRKARGRLPIHHN